VSNTTIHCADVVAWAHEYTGDPFHAVLCDPPYHLQSIVERFSSPNAAPAKPGTDGAFQRASRGFMGETWDGGDVAFNPQTWEAVLACLHPGAFGLAFSGARTYYKLPAAIETGGGLIHPALFLWVHAGMPKATRVSTGDAEIDRRFEGHRYGAGAIKPCVEPIVLFQKPYTERPRSQIAQTGAGAINIDAGRIPSDDSYAVNTWDDDAHPFGDGAGNEYTTRQESERWPGNLIIEDVGSALSFDINSQHGFTHHGFGVSRFFYTVGGHMDDAIAAVYYSKVQPKERNAGVVGGNPHATLKPILLAKYLASLLLPPPEYAPRRILVPFAGTGSEMIGAALAGWEEVVGVELLDKNCDIARQRIKHWLELPLFG